MIKTLLPLVMLLVAAFGVLGCEDDVFLCESPDSCSSQAQCFELCQNECVDGAFNLDGRECILPDPFDPEIPGDCFCECFVGCGVLDDVTE
ncbi:MAG: hypothetical protein AAF997_09655 [Myxococcota bacterium]